METIGSAGANSNFTAVFTVPPQMTLEAYTRQTFGATPNYDTITIRRAVPLAKVAAVVTAVGAVGKIGFGGLGGGTAAPQFNRFRIRFNVTGGSSRTNAQLTALLAAIETAITT